MELIGIKQEQLGAVVNAYQALGGGGFQNMVRRSGTKDDLNHQIALCPRPREYQQEHRTRTDVHPPHKARARR